ncbi:HlyC/CorC family transporter [Waterburya agarophytonicola K14]|uniref:HlyC/CorC family transporter n=1 Tax=Waterburya agarophytonicola KI4 TaxID=2874699 RepID=A0A964BPH2_9CYAN|nr:hemolysin family protein [Waterburya agarophytonicola]MCC0176874.1 HlyC/CorC family transporter [Waterburya agarophytonicola KI4]
MLALIIVVTTVLLGSAFCSGSEAALLSISPIKVRQLAQSKKPAALALAGIRLKVSRPIATIVILNNVFNIVGSILVGSLTTKELGGAWLGVFSGVLTFLIIVFGEIVPKTLCQRYAEPVCLAIAIPVKFLTVIFTPLVWLVENVTTPFTQGQKMPTTNEAEIKFLTNIGFQEGVIEDDEAEMIQRVFQLNDLNASDLMTPRIIITYLKGDKTLAESQQEIIKSQHTRILVIDDTIDNVTGLVLKDELLTAMIEGQGDRQINDLKRPVQFVPETNRADKLLKVFQDNREHLAVVLDEYGGVAGVVTLEDVLEVLTGEIVDETDRNVDLQEIARKKRLRLLKSRGINND